MFNNHNRTVYIMVADAEFQCDCLKINWILETANAFQMPCEE